MNKKVILLGLVAFVAIIAYVFLTNPLPEESSRSESLAPNHLKGIASNSLNQEVKEVPKTDVYAREQEQLLEQQQQQAYQLENQTPVDLTESMTSVYKSSLATSDSDTPPVQEDLVATYNGSTYKPKASDPITKDPIRSQKIQTTGKEQPVRVATTRKDELKSMSDTKPKSSTNESIFNTMVYTEDSNQPTSSPSTGSFGANSSIMVKASVLGPHNVKNGGVIRFRLLEQAIFQGKTFPRNTIFFGKATFSNERLNVRVDRLPLEKGFESVTLVLHDQDLQEGIYAPVKDATNAATNEGIDGVNEVLTSAGTVVGTIGTGVGTILRTATNGSQKIAISDGYAVLFVLTQN